MGEVRFMISEAAKQVDVESHVLRYWEEELGLRIGRTEMGHRYYTKDDIQLFRCIKKLKDEGMLLRDLKPLIPELKETRLKLKTTDSDSPAKTSGSESSSYNLKTASPDTPAPSGITALSAETATESGEVVIPLNTVEQMRSLVGDIFREVLTENNDVLKKDISSTVTTDVIHEMDFLFQAKERQQEEHFRKLDSLIRQQQAVRRETAKGGAIMKLRKMFT